MIIILFLIFIIVFYKRIIQMLIRLWIGVRRYLYVSITNKYASLTSEKNHGIYYGYDGPNRIVMIGSYNLSKNFYSLTKKILERNHDYLGRTYDILFKECIGTKWGETWLKMKKPLDGYFNNGSVRDYYELLDNCIDNWIKSKFEIKIRGYDHFELCLGDLELDKLTMNFLAVMVFGKVTDEDLDRLYELAKLHEKILPMMSEYSPIRYGFRVGFQKEINDIRLLNKKWIEFMTDIIGKSEGLVNHFASEPTYMNDQKKIIHTLYEIILFNADIMTNAITHIIRDLALNPDIQEDLINAIKKSDMEYIKRIITESARLHPGILNTFTDLVSDDFVFEDFTFPSGTMFSLDTFMINTDPNMWSNPLVFNPNRYDNEDIDKVYRFGLGQRKCIGRISADVILQKVIQKIFSVYYVVPIQNTFDKKEEKSYVNIATGCIDNVVKIYIQ